MSAYVGPNAVDLNLAYELDPLNPKCYGGSGTVITDLSKNRIAGSVATGVRYTDLGGSFHVVAVNPLDTGYIITDAHTVELVFTKNVDSGYWNGVWASEIWNLAQGYIAYFAGRNTLNYTRGGGTGGLAIDVSAVNILSAQHYVFTRASDGSAAFYLNGVLVTSGGAGALPVSASPVSKSMVLGCRHGNDGTGTGDYGTSGVKVGLCRAYTRPLTATEVRQNFLSIRARYGL